MNKMSGVMLIRDQYVNIRHFMNEQLRESNVERKYYDKQTESIFKESGYGNGSHRSDR